MCISQSVVGILTFVFSLSHSILSYFYAAKLRYVFQFLNFLSCSEQFSPSPKYESIQPYFPRAFMFAFLKNLHLLHFKFISESGMSWDAAVYFISG